MAAHIFSALPWPVRAKPAKMHVKVPLGVDGLECEARRAVCGPARGLRSSAQRREVPLRRFVHMCVDVHDACSSLLLGFPHNKAGTMHGWRGVVDAGRGFRDVALRDGKVAAQDAVGMLL